jgi:hypothetical protein
MHASYEHQLVLLSFPAVAVAVVVCCRCSLIAVAVRCSLSAVCCSLLAVAVSCRLSLCHRWAVDGEHAALAVTELPLLCCPPGRTRLVNDMVGFAEGILSISSRAALPSTFDVLWEGGAGCNPALELCAGSLGAYTVAVVAVGTGVGNVALMHRVDMPFATLDDVPGQYHVVPLEVGHQTITAMPHLSGFLEFARKRVRGGTDSAVEWDDVCSGRGLVIAYQYLRESEGECTQTAAPALDDAGAIASCWTSNPTAERALCIYYDVIMRFAANLCIGIQAQGLVFAGDNQVSVLPRGYPAMSLFAGVTFCARSLALTMSTVCYHAVLPRFV